MPTVDRGKYILSSQPRYDSKLDVWFPYASVAWHDLDDHSFHHHELKGLNRRFKKQEEALSFGFIVARAWVEKSQSDLKH
jgi:hypothetical protein